MKNDSEEMRRHVIVIECWWKEQRSQGIRTGEEEVGTCDKNVSQAGHILAVPSL